jgi:hypothetical protein
MNKLLAIVHMGDFGHMGKWKKAHLTRLQTPNSSEPAGGHKSYL